MEFDSCYLEYSICIDSKVPLEAIIPQQLWSCWDFYNWLSEKPSKAILSIFENSTVGLCMSNYAWIIKSKQSPTLQLTEASGSFPRKAKITGVGDHKEYKEQGSIIYFLKIKASWSISDKNKKAEAPGREQVLLFKVIKCVSFPFQRP